MKASGGERGRGAEFGAVLSELRAAKGLTRRKLAELAAIDRSVLSRIERGAYPHQITTGLVEKLTFALEAGVSLYRAARLPLPAASELIASPDVSGAFQELHTARRVLRQLHLESLAQPVAYASRSGTGLQIDAGKLWRVAGGQGPLPGSGPGRSADAAQRRFQIAHVAAHHMLAAPCEWPMVSPLEIDANDLAGALLAPRTLMVQALKAAFANSIDPWSPDADGLVGHVADYFLIPGWVALRRIGMADELNYYLDADEEWE